MSRSNPFRKRLPVFIRDNWHCQFCGQDLLADEQAFRLATVDHLMPINLGGGNEQENLVTCCYLCNQAKGDIPVVNIKDAQKLVRERRRAVLAQLLKEMDRFGQSFPRQYPADFMQSAMVTVDSTAVQYNVPVMRTVAGPPTSLVFVHR